MSDILSDEDAGALAAEYVLGTLGADERTRANALLDVDGSFRGMVRIWERWLGDLHLMVEPVEPPPQIWERLAARMEGVRPSMPVAAAEPETAAAVAAEGAAEGGADAAEAAAEPAAGEALATAAVEGDVAEAPATAAEAASPETTLDALEAELRKSGLIESKPPPPVIAPRLPETVTRDRGTEAPAPRARTYSPPGAVVARDLRPALRRWRVFAVLVTLMLVAGGGLVAAWRYVPERLPPELRANVVLDYLRVFPPPPTPPPRPKAPPASQFDE
jgi:hypothetical protein